jgi:hypothetical protein
VLPLTLSKLFFPVLENWSTCVEGISNFSLLPASHFRPHNSCDSFNLKLRQPAFSSSVYSEALKHSWNINPAQKAENLVSYQLMCHLFESAPELVGICAESNQRQISGKFADSNPSLILYIF